MANKKKKPAAGNSVAGKNNSDKKANKSSASAKKSAQKKALDEQKAARKVIEKSAKAQAEREKKSEEIRKNREKQKNAERKLAQKEEAKLNHLKKRKNLKKKLKKILKRIQYYTSKEFLKSFNYARIFLFIILPVAALVVACTVIFQSVFFHVPGDIRNFVFNGRVESETIVSVSDFNEGQKQAMVDSTEAKGSRKFDFYINKTVYIDDTFSTSDLCFGNPNDDCILVMTLINSDDEVLYRSLGVEPGEEMEKMMLFDGIAYGEHKVTVCVNAYNKETYEKIGTKYAKIKLAVGVEADE